MFLNVADGHLSSRMHVCYVTEVILSYLKHVLWGCTRCEYVLV